MTPKRPLSALLALLLAGNVGCYTTRVVTNAPGAHNRTATSDRQWFTLGGLLALSNTPGRECASGVARAESGLGAVDFLITVGLMAAGGVASVMACENLGGGGLERTAACGLAGATVLPFFIGSRSVTYTCAEGAGLFPTQDAPGSGAPPPPLPPVLPPPPMLLPPPPTPAP